MSVFAAVVSAAHSAVDALATFLTPVAGSLAVALAIVLFTVLVRLLISPLTYLQARRAKRAAALAPQSEQLRKKHTEDAVALAGATLALQRANGVSPFTSLLPALVQWPFFAVMYRVALHAPSGAVFGVPLGAHLAAGWPVFGVLLMCSVLLARRAAAMMPVTAPAGDAAVQVAGILRFLPYLTVFAVAWLPLAGSLYLVTSTAWTALEQTLWRRPAPASSR